MTKLFVLSETVVIALPYRVTQVRFQVFKQHLDQ